MDVGIAGEVPAQLFDDASQQARHLHLAHAQLLADLSLRALLDESQPEDQPLLFRQPGDRPPERVQLVDGLGAAWRHEDVIGEAGARRGDGVEGGGPVPGGAESYLGDVVDRHPQHGGQLVLPRLA